MSDRLAEIMDWKRREIEPVIRPISERELERLARPHESERFLMQKALRRNEAQLSVISEIKRRSPSAGAIAENASAVEQAIKYVNGNADALSILTDEKYFGGTIKDLWEVVELLQQHRRNTPCLRKDFMLHPVQVVEAAEAGAAVILIIVRALDDDQIKRLYNAANIIGLDSLFEIHEERELEKALRHDPKIIGVNNRDLSRFTTDLAHTEHLLPQMPDDIIKLSESGIFELEDALRAKDAGADGVLIGQALMEAEDPEAFIEAIHEL